MTLWHCSAVWHNFTWHLHIASAVPISIPADVSVCPELLAHRRDRIVRVLKLPTGPDDYAFMLSEDYAAAVQHQQHLMQVRQLAFILTSFATCACV